MRGARGCKEEFRILEFCLEFCFPFWICEFALAFWQEIQFAKVMVRWFASETEEVRVAKGGAPASAGGGAPQARKARQTSFVKPPSREKMEIMSRQMMQEQELEWQQAARLEEMLMLHQRQVHARRLAALKKMAFMGLKQFTTSAKMERVRVAEKAHAKEQAAAESARLARQAAEVARESREQAYLQRRTVQVELLSVVHGKTIS